MNGRRFRSSFPDFEESGFRSGAWANPAAALEPYHETLLDALSAAAHSDKTGITLVGDSDEEGEQHRSYRTLAAESRAIAHALVDLGVRPRERVMLVLGSSFEFFTALFAVLTVGAVPVPGYPPAMLERAETAIDRLCHIARTTEASWCITGAKLRPLFGELARSLGGVRRLLAVEELKGGARLRGHAAADGESIAFIQCTSGSTGHPKGVVLTHGNVIANIHAIGRACRINRRDVTVSWLPLYHDMGLIGALLFSLYWRIPLVLLPPLAFLSRPARWLWAIHRHRGTLSPAPNFAYALCSRRVRAAERQGLDLSSWRLALNGAEPVNLRTLQDFRRTFVPNGFQPNAMLPVYGLAEASVAVTFHPLDETVRHQQVDRLSLAGGLAVPSHAKGSVHVVSVGRALPGHEVVVLDDHARPLADGQVGHIVVRGPSVMRGYFKNEEATRAVKRDGWLWTGDLGYFSDGDLFVTGRAKDLIIVRGHNFYAEDVERVAEHVEGVRSGGAVAFGMYDEDKASDLAVLVCETRVEDRAAKVALVERVVERVAEDCGLRLDEVVLLGPGSVPKTSSGKRQRALCRELYLKGELGKRKSWLGVPMVFMRSGAGFLVAGVKRLLKLHRREAD
jgi:acyl-CoA synthetase (AMP-forming)/AMP-acid ligase II